MRQYRTWIGLIALLGLTWLAYRPGLSGGFLFDDYNNLDALGNDGPVASWPVFWRYLTSGTADPIGRPLSLLSFLIDARDWPANPGSFLRTNLLLHLFNGALLFSLLRKLDRFLGMEPALGNWVALLATGMWLLHPLFVSTTLYAVQREAMLPVTFALLGLLAYTHGRARFAASQGAAGAAWMISGVCLGTLLAALCKANGLLVPLLAWVLEETVFARGAEPAGAPGASRRLSGLRGVLLVLPSVLLLAYLSHFLFERGSSFDRPWTILQRLLTEPRVLLDYLRLLAVPRSVSTGLYNDDYPVSRDLLHPASTLPALMAILAVVAIAWRLRRTFPAAAAALLFFFAAHLLESSVVPLELYYEHRNYLPAMLLFWPLARALSTWRIGQPARMALAAGLVAMLAVITHQRTELWGHPDRLAQLWLLQNPESSRALATVSIQLVDSGHPHQALLLLGPAWRKLPYDSQIAVNYIDAACAAGGLPRGDVDALGQTLRHSPERPDLLFVWMDKAFAAVDSGECPGLTLDSIEFWLKQMGENTAFRSDRREQNLQSLSGQLALRKHEPALALEHFNRALLASVNPAVAASQAAMLGANHYYDQALAHLDLYQQVSNRAPRPEPGMAWLHAQVLQWQGYWPQELANLRRQLQSRRELSAKPGTKSL